MNSKISLFNKHIIKSDIKRFWWIPVLFMVIMAFVLPGYVYEIELKNETAIGYATDGGFFAFIFSFFTSGMLFSYLHKGNSVTVLHGIPVTRTQHYISHYISGIILIMIPVIISSTVIGLESLCYGETVNYAVKYFYTCCIYAGVAFSITAFTSVISGNTAAAYIFSVGFMILPLFITLSAYGVLKENLYGFNGIIIYSKLNKYFYLIGIDNMRFFMSIGKIIVTIVLFIAALILYRIRNLENYDEVVAFKYLRYAFVYVLAVSFGLIGYFLLNLIFDVKNIFIGMMPLGIIAIIAANMLNNKSFRLKGALKPIVIFAVCVAIVNAVFIFDLTGFERRIPDFEDIESITINNNYNISYVNNRFIEDIYYDNVKFKPVLTDKKEIENIYNLHNALINRRNKIEGDYKTNMYFTYNLKNGDTITRFYDIYGLEYDEYLNAFYATDAYKKMNYPIVNDNEKHINYVEYYNNENGEMEKIALEKK